jgi:anhydro-N-acetylmuramic acid kinase
MPKLLSRFSGAEVVGFHGQTLAHDPRGRGTHQAATARLLARCWACRWSGISAPPT